jgi:glycosyltransferase involved in cell wall biosynthesis
MKILLFANTDWYLYNFRLPLAQKLREAGFDVVLVSPPGKFSSLLEQAGFRWIAFPFSRKGQNPLQEHWTIWRLTRLYRQEKPDLVHHFTIKCVLYGSLAARRTGIHAVVNAITGLGYVFMNNTLPGKLIRWIVKLFYRSALKGTQVIFQNPDDRKVFLDFGLTQFQNTHLIYGSGIDLNHFVPLPEPDTIPLIVLPGRMLWDKGVGDFVEAARILRGREIQARFALVGASDLHNPSAIPLEQLDQWQKESLVEWWDFQDNIKAIFAQAHIICLPSYREGLPRVLTEAAACQRALVTTDAPGCREVVQNGTNGLLVPSRNPVALANALQTLIENPGLRRQMAIRGREIAAAQFSVEQVNLETLNIYRELLP